MPTDDSIHKLETDIEPGNLQENIDKYEKGFYLQNEEIQKFLIKFLRPVSSTRLSIDNDELIINHLNP